MNNCLLDKEIERRENESGVERFVPLSECPKPKTERDLKDALWQEMDSEIKRGV